jgi:hypothetical protein
MAHSTIALVSGQWTLLTATNVTALRIQNISGYEVKIQATVGTTPPTDDAAGHAGEMELLPNQGWDADVALSARFGGVSGANRVWAYAVFNDAASVSVSYA